MNLVRPVVAFALLPLVLAACSSGGNGGGDGPITRQIPEVAQNDEYQDLTPITRTIPGNSFRAFRFDTFSADDEAIFFVASAGDLYVEEDDGDVIATSSTRTFFGAGESGIISVDPMMRGQALGPVNTTCIGPCVILDAPSAPRHVWAVVENPFDTPLDVDLYVFSQRFDDESEPENDLPRDADVVDDSGLRGALETIGDVDYWETAETTAVTVSAPVVPSDGFADDYLTLEVAVVDSDGNLVNLGAGVPNPVTVAPDDSVTFDTIFAGDDFIRIRAADDRAAPAAASFYTVFTGP